MRTVLFLTILISFSESAKLPLTFKKCSLSQENLNDCLSDAIKNALEQMNKPIKSIGVPNLDPLEIPSLVVEAGPSAVRFTQNYKDCRIIGLSKPLSVNASMDLDKNILTANFHYPQEAMEFKYSITGKILILPIFGDGTGKITLDEPTFKFKFYLEKYYKKNVQHFKVIKTTLSVQIKQIHFELDNLFNGDKQLSDNILQVINENWKEVYLDVQSGYEEAFEQIFMSIFNNILNRVSVKDIFDN